MSEGGAAPGTAPEAAPENDAPPAPMRKVSGLLVVSIFLSFSGFLGFAVIGPLAGLIIAWFGWRRVKVDPFLVGPRFAKICLVVGAMALVGNIISLAFMYDKLMWWPTTGGRIQAVMLKVQDRDFEGAFNEMSDDYRADHDKVGFAKTISDLFPGEDPILVDEQTLSLRVKEWNAEQVEKDAAVMWGDEPTPFEVMVPIRILYSVKTGAEMESRPVDFDFYMWVRKTGYGEYEAKILDIEVRLAPPEEPELKPADTVPEDAPEDEPK